MLLSFLTQEALSVSHNVGGTVISVFGCLFLLLFATSSDNWKRVKANWVSSVWVRNSPEQHQKIVYFLSPVALSYCMNPLGNFISELWNTSCINCYCLTVQPCSLWCQEISKNKQRNKLKNVNLKHFAITFNYDIYLWCLVGRVCAKSTTFCLLQFINYWFIIESSE